MTTLKDKIRDVVTKHAKDGLDREDAIEDMVDEITETISDDLRDMVDRLLS